MLRDNYRLISNNLSTTQEFDTLCLRKEVLLCSEFLTCLHNTRKTVFPRMKPKQVGSVFSLSLSIISFSLVVCLWSMRYSHIWYSCIGVHIWIVMFIFFRTPEIFLCLASCYDVKIPKWLQWNRWIHSETKISPLLTHWTYHSLNSVWPGRF